MRSNVQVLVRLHKASRLLPAKTKLKPCVVCVSQPCYAGTIVCLDYYHLTHIVVTRRVADWFAQLNEKMGGDLKKIKVVGQYMIEIWKACGMEGIDSDQVPHSPSRSGNAGLGACFSTVRCTGVVATSQKQVRIDSRGDHTA